MRCAGRYNSSFGSAIKDSRLPQATPRAVFPRIVQQRNKTD
jgi:hypothetical protein